MIERRPIVPAQEKDDSRSGRLCQRTFDRRYGFALDLLLGEDVVAEFSIGGSVGGLGTIGRA